MSRRWGIGCGIVFSIGLAFVVLILYENVFRTGVVNSSNYSRGKVGMRLEEVIELLGPGDEVDPKQLTRDIRGDRFFQWPKNRDILHDKIYIVIGFIKDRVCDKYCWQLSL